MFFVPVLGADARGERRVGGDARAQVGEAPPERRLLRVEVVVRLGARRVDRRARRKQERERLERVVGVLRDAAAHPARVVRDDAAERARRDGRRVRPDLPAERREGAVRVRADHARLDADARTAVLDREAAEAPRRLDEDAVRDGLAREARPGRAEDERHAVGARDREEAPDFVGAPRVDDGLRHEPVEARVGRPGYPVDRAGEDAGLADGRGEGGGERGRGLVHSGGDRSVWIGSSGVSGENSPKSSWKCPPSLTSNASDAHERRHHR